MAEGVYISRLPSYLCTYDCTLRAHLSDLFVPVHEPDLDAGDEEALASLAVLGEVDQLGPEPHRVQRAEVPGGANTAL